MIGISALGDPVPVVLDDRDRVHAFLIGIVEEALVPQVLQLDREGQTVRVVEVQADLVQPDRPDILWDGSQLHLFWLSDRSLYHATLSTDGDILVEPERISGDISTDRYAAAAGRDGRISVFFSGPRREPGLYAVDLGTGDILPLAPRGVRPQLVYGDDGTLHALWALYPSGLGRSALYYAAYPQGNVLPGEEHVIAEPSLGVANVLQGPQLGLDNEQVYVFWTERIMVGMQVGVVESNYLSFPIGSVADTRGLQILRAPDSYELPYQAWSSPGFSAGERVDLTAGRISSTGLLTDLFPVRNPSNEFAAAFEVKADYLRRKTEIQIGLLYLDGNPTSYQLISFTSVGSQSPFLLADEDDLYLTWVEKAVTTGYEVFFTTTAADLSEALNTITRADVAAMAGSALFGFLSGMLLLPMGLIWIVLPVLILVLASFVRDDDASFWSPLNLFSLMLALIAYWASKFTILPGISSYVPFSAWIPILPDAWSLPLRIGIPVLIALTGLLTAYRFFIRRELQSNFFFMLMYAVVDGLLTLGVYGVLIYGG